MATTSLFVKDIDSELKKFKQFLEIDGMAPRTNKTYLDEAKYIFNHLSPLNRLSFDEFILDLKLAKKSTGYLNNLIKTIKKIAKFHQLPGFDDLKLLRPNDVNKATMSETELQAFLGQTTSPKFDLFWKIMVYIGARPSEIAGLKCNEVDFSQNTLFFMRTKNKHPRPVPIPESIVSDLKSLIVENHRTYVFGTPNHDQPISSKSWDLNFRKRMNRLGIKRPGLTPYSIRHSLITKLINEDVNVLRIAKLVGHRNIATTTHYFHSTTKDLESLVNEKRFVPQSESPEKLLKEILVSVKRLREMLNLPTIKNK